MATKTEKAPKKAAPAKATAKKAAPKKATAKKAAPKKATAKKAAPKKTTAKKAAPKKASSAKARFPKRELNSWLRQNNEWGHDEWTALLADLSKNGFGEWADNQEGQNEIGLYLESNRK